MKDWPFKIDLEIELEPIVKLSCQAINCQHHMKDRNCCNYKIVELDDDGWCKYYANCTKEDIVERE